jgi:hypothetical protein
MNWSYCYIEQASSGKWYIMWPDCTRACDQGFKTRGWATRTLNELKENK